MALKIMGKHKVFQDQVNNLCIDLTHSEVEQYNQNHAAKGDIGHQKKSEKIPKHLWGYSIVHPSGILSSIAHDKTGYTGIEEVVGQTPEIYEWLDFDFYDCVLILDNKHTSTTDNIIILERWLGISHKIGSNMCYLLLTVSGKVITQTTVQHVIYTDFYT